MNQASLSRSLKMILAGVGICGLIVYFAVLPAVGGDLRTGYPEFAGWYRPWLIFLWCTSVPCFLVLALGWKIAGNIGADRSFSLENAQLLRRIAWLAAGDTVFFFAGNVVLFFLSMNHPGILLASLLICFAGVAVTVAAVCLSHLVHKAAELQEQSDLTI